MNSDPRIGPLVSAGARGPCVITVIKIMSMLNNANVLAFASYADISGFVYVDSVGLIKFEMCHSSMLTFAMSLYKLKG